METIWVTAVHHKHGHDTYLNKTREGATRDLYGYVSDSWDESEDGPIPEDMEGAIDQYFDNNGEEYFTCDFLEVGD